MNNYALSSCLLEKSKVDKKIVTSILHKISDENTPYKVVVDKYGVIIDLYERIANDNNVHVASWLRILTREPEQVEFMDIKLDPNAPDIVKFLETASNIRNEKKLIVYSHNSLPDCFPYQENNQLIYNNHTIKIFNSNEAMSELNKTNGVVINNENNLNSNNKSKTVKDSFIVGKKNKIEKSSFDNKSSKKVFSRENILITLLIGILASIIAAWIWSRM